MSWTTPRTWVDGDNLTATMLNTHIRDNLDVIGDPWTSYSTAWTAGGTNPVIGNGTLTSVYSQVGKTVRFAIRMVAGSTTTFGSNAWRVTLPTATASFAYSFRGTIRDDSAGDTMPFQGELSNVADLTEIIFRMWPTTAGAQFVNGTSTVPFTWATGDYFSLDGTYEAA